MIPAAGLALAGVVLMAVGLPLAAATPEPPRAWVDTTPVQPAGRTIAVPTGGDLQAALDGARPGDVITLEAGATFIGPFTLPTKVGGGWITVRTSAPESGLPPPGTRIDPSHAGALPKIVAAVGPVIAAARGAHHYRFVGIEIHPVAGALLRNLVELGSAETSVDRLPHHIVFDRCYLHGDPRRGTRRGIALNARDAAVIDSYLSDFKEVGNDSQAIAGWNGPGPFKIVNNYLEGAGENLMFGGADPAIPGLVPSDIEIRRNHLAKPLAWKQGDPAYAGVPWTVKNLFELKNARRVLVDGNLLERNWAQAQSGFAVLFTVRNQDGGAPWSVVEDVAFTNNVLRGTASGVNILGRDDTRPAGSQQTKRILIKNNLFLDVGGPRWGGGGVLFQILNGTASVVIDHNTAFQTGNILTAEGPTHAGFVFTHNIVPHNAFGIVGTGTAPGIATLNAYFPGAVVRKNVIVGGGARQYPPGNFFPQSFAAVRFENPADGLHRLAAASPYRRAALDGTDVGVDIGALPRAVWPGADQLR
ncbi:MAG: hypothetical protein HY727_17575 [Candidatus Rokubacteria bacterium]|nr:hypothetical protein [Candidatus Rokubacteria bacterium]